MIYGKITWKGKLLEAAAPGATAFAWELERAVSVGIGRLRCSGPFPTTREEIRRQVSRDKLTFNSDTHIDIDIHAKAHADMRE